MAKISLQQVEDDSNSKKKLSFLSLQRWPFCAVLTIGATFSSLNVHAHCRLVSRGSGGILITICPLLLAFQSTLPYPSRVTVVLDEVFTEPSVMLLPPSGHCRLIAYTALVDTFFVYLREEIDQQKNTKTISYTYIIYTYHTLPSILSF